MHEPLVTGELHDSGLAILRNPRWRKRWNTDQFAVIESQISFHLVRFDFIGRQGMFAVPVYRVTNWTNSESFLFRNIPWQLAWTEGLESGPQTVGESQ